MSTSKCLACGIEKDIEKEEIYPYEDDSIITEEPVRPLFDIPCQSYTDWYDFRIAIICHKCFHIVRPDMWMRQAEWEYLNPITPFNDLPKDDN